jgi:hypothetical protein
MTRTKQTVRKSDGGKSPSGGKVLRKVLGNKGMVMVNGKLVKVVSSGKAMPTARAGRSMTVK